MDTIRTILLTTDFSETSARAFAAARSLADRFGARIEVLHVEDDRVSPLLVEYMAVGLESVRQRQVASASRQLEEFVAEHLGSDAQVGLEVCLGVPHVEIVRLAAERDVDLIVMATHGRGFISHAMMGSTTERVLRRAPCPVLVVPG
jgi:nucleotide-binding universal stress UspA family protein